MKYLALLVLAACGSGMPTAEDIANYRSTELACVDTFDARPDIDMCRKVEKQNFCAKFKNACASNDAGAE